MSTLFYPEKIIDSKFEKNKSYFLVKWHGYKTPTWEPEKYLSHRKDLIDDHRDMFLIENLDMKTGGYIYCRVSSTQQSKYNDGHTSLQVQEKYIREYCETNDINVIRVVKEVYSARNMDKLCGLKYLCDIASAGQTIYVYDISRFSRNIHHSVNILEELKDRKISVHSVSENITYSNSSGRNQFRLQLCASTYYSDLCSHKVKASIAFRRARGDYIGNTSYGYMTEVDKKTNIRIKIPCVPEMKVIESIREMDKRWVHPNIIVDTLIKKGINFRGRIPVLTGVKRIISRLETDLKQYISCNNDKKHTYNLRYKPY
jgi:DNA invertase Pin-like site-specific DNA recombinase